MGPAFQPRTQEGTLAAPSAAPGAIADRLPFLLVFHALGLVFFFLLPLKVVPLLLGRAGWAWASFGVGGAGWAAASPMPPREGHPGWQQCF